MPEGNNIPKTSPSFSGASSVSSPSLVMRALAQSRALDGGFQKSSTMWNQVTRNRYPSGKMKVIGSSSSRKKDIGLQEDMDYMQSIYDLLGMQFSGGWGKGGLNVSASSPFTKGSFGFSAGKAMISGDYEKVRSGEGLRNYDWNIGIDIPIDFFKRKRR
tara:strand:- start:430 stop:906 length:477 start_codon:yes stop_codon:yes gene_type:complete